MDNAILNGRRGSLHFIRFPTCEIQAFLRLVKTKRIACVSSTVCATGGGAYKFEKDFQEVKIHGRVDANGTFFLLWSSSAIINVYIYYIQIISSFLIRRKCSWRFTNSTRWTRWYVGYSSSSSKIPESATTTAIQWTTSAVKKCLSTLATPIRS